MEAQERMGMHTHTERSEETRERYTISGANRERRIEREASTVYVLNMMSITTVLIAPPTPSLFRWLE